ncbi:MAG: EAL domain-containing protein [Pontixanthobacter sp.]
MNTRQYKTRAVAAVAIVLSAVFAIAWTDGFRALERGIQSTAFALQSRAASGQLHVVEMDAASVGAIDRWPWPRSNYAKLVERLNAAGARTIVFDVDFSSASEPAEDRAFADAIARSDANVILPTFAQIAGFDNRRELDSLPISMLREHAMLGSVSVRPDSDGLVRNMLLGTVTQGTPRPSLSAKIAQRSGRAGQQFPIDYTIDPRSIPRHSFIAVANGRFDADAIRGKDVLIGATAIEMGDRYTVPTHGILPGVIVQALASETLYRGIPQDGGWLPLLVLAAFLSALLMVARTRQTVAAIAAIAATIVIGTHMLTVASFYVILQIAPALAMIAICAIVQTLLLIRDAAKIRRLIDDESRLPNALALTHDAGTNGQTYTVVARIENFDGLLSVVGANNTGFLINRVADRLRTVSGGAAIHRTSDRTLAWNSRLEHYELQDALSGLNAIMRSPIEIAGRHFDINLNCGVAESGALAHASHAASLAHDQGASWQYNEVAERAALEQQLSLMGELDQAIAQDELQVLFQPKLHLPTNRVTSVEALIRWHHPERGFLRPDSFIPLAEQSDRIADLTLYVLKQTIEDLKAWCAQGLTLKAAVNISARLVSSPSFIAAAENILQQTGVPRERLIFEVTESATMNDPEAAVKALDRFRALGIAISMDDYGTGQSSLTYLRNLPLSELKIDRSFVQFAHRDHNDGLLVRSTVQLAHSLGLQVVAEGVEDEECLDFLREIECDLAQGYHIGKPMEAERIAQTALEYLDQAA